MKKLTELLNDDSLTITEKIELVSSWDETNCQGFVYLNNEKIEVGNYSTHFLQNLHAVCESLIYEREAFDRFHPHLEPHEFNWNWSDVIVYAETEKVKNKLECAGGKLGDVITSILGSMNEWKPVNSNNVY